MNTYARWFHSFRLLLLFIAALALLTGDAFAKTVNVKGYTRKDGTYVAPHVRTSPNSTKSDNWSTRGNVNPYTGQKGTKPGDGQTSTGTTTQRRADTYTAPATTANTRGSPTATHTKPTTPAPNLLALVKSGMTKSEVLSIMGSPNVVTSTKWLYTDQGTVIFNAKGIVQ